MNVLSTTVTIDGVPYGPIEDERLAGPPVETDDDFKARHFAHVEAFCNAVGGTLERLKTTWRSNGSSHGSETWSKAGWTTAQAVAEASANVGAAWTVFPPDE